MACTQAATKCLPTNGPLGGLGLLLPMKEFAPLNADTPYEPATRPATVSNTATTHQQMVFDREMMALGALTTAVYDSIPLATRQSCPGYHATYGTSFIPLPTMMDHVRAKFGDSSVHAYEAARATLLRPFTGGDLDAYLATHVDAHLACARAGNPLNDCDKVGALLTGVGGRSGAYGFTICQFEENTPFHLRKFEDTPATEEVPEVQATLRIEAHGDQADVPAVAYVPGHPATPACDGLATRLRKAAQRVPAPAAATPTTHGYYGAAATSPLLNIRAELTAALKDLLPPTLTDANAVAAPGPVPTTTTPRRGRKEFYCWSHGLCGHAGKDCRNVRVGHNPKAMVSNRMGGSNKGCPK